jgi:hypothetical protein
MICLNKLKINVTQLHPSLLRAWWAGMCDSAKQSLLKQSVFFSKGLPALVPERLLQPFKISFHNTLQRSCLFKSNLRWALQWGRRGGGWLFSYSRPRTRLNCELGGLALCVGAKQSVPKQFVFFSKGLPALVPERLLQPFRISFHNTIQRSCLFKSNLRWASQ